MAVDRTSRPRVSDRPLAKAGLNSERLLWPTKGPGVFEQEVENLEDALGPNAYWRAPTWKRVAAIAAGPAANIVLALLLFTGLFMTSAGKATTRVEAVSSGTPAAAEMRPWIDDWCHRLKHEPGAAAAAVENILRREVSC